LGPPALGPPSVLYAEKLSSGTSSVNKKQLADLITDKGIQVVSSHIKQDGSAVFSCQTPRDSDILKKTITEHFPEATTRPAAPLLPTISVRSLDTKYTPSELQDTISKQNHAIKTLIEAEGEDAFKVLDIREHKFNKARFHATIRVSNDIRLVIKKQNEKLFIGSSSCPVVSHVHIKRCNYCQRLGHYAVNCKARLDAAAPTCGHCTSQEHESTGCPHVRSPTFRPSCANCKNNKFKGVKDSHSAFANDCPSYLAEQEKLKSKIFYYNHAKN
jgi:hypothetical protein